MKVKNVSARLHHVGNISIAPGETKDIGKEFEASINKVDLVPVVAEQPKTLGRPRKADEE